MIGTRVTRKSAMKMIVVFLNVIKWFMTAGAFFILFKITFFISEPITQFINSLIDFLPLILISAGGIFYAIGVFAIMHHLIRSHHVFDIQFVQYMMISLAGTVTLNTGLDSIFDYDNDLASSIVLSLVPILVLVHARIARLKKYSHLMKFIKKNMISWINATAWMCRISISSAFTKSFNDYGDTMVININNFNEYLHNTFDDKIKFIQEEYMHSVMEYDVGDYSGPSAYFLKIGRMPTVIGNKNEKVHIWCKISASIKSIDLMKDDHHLKCVEWMNRAGVQTELIYVGVDQAMTKLNDTWTSLMLLYVSPSDLLKKFAIINNPTVPLIAPINSVEPCHAFNNEYSTWYLSVQNPNLHDIDDMIDRVEAIEQRKNDYVALYRAGDHSEHVKSNIMQCERKLSEMMRFMKKIKEIVAKGFEQ